MVFTVVQPAFAGSGSEAASFLDIPVGAGPAAMGAAYSALADDAYAPVYNPGGLGFVDSTQISGQHLSYLDSIYYESLSFVHPAGQGGALGLSAQYLGSGSISGTDINGNPIGSYSTTFGAYSLAYGHQLGDRLSIGLTGKVIDAKIADVGAQAYAADIGSFYKVTDKLNLAVVATNMGTKLNFIDAPGTLPEALKVGGAYQPSLHWKMSVEGEFEGSGVNSGHVGLEWKPLEMIAIRAGYQTDTTKELGAMAGVSTGIGVDLWGQELAYAWVPYGDLGNTQYFSLLIRFGQKDQEKRNLIQYQSIKQHRTVQGDSAIEPSDPDYQQLMQLLSDQDREVYSRRAITSEAAPQ